MFCSMADGIKKSLSGLVHCTGLHVDRYYSKHEGNTACGTGDFTVGTSQRRLASEKATEVSTKSEAGSMEESSETDSGD